MQKLHVYLGDESKSLRKTMRMYGYVKELPDGGKMRFVGRAMPLTLHRATLMALYMAVHKLEDNYEIHVYTTDSYVISQIENGNLQKWEANGFRGSKGEVRDADLWKELGRKIRYQKIVGHIGPHVYEKRMSDWFRETGTKEE